MSEKFFGINFLKLDADAFGVSDWNVGMLGQSR